MATSDKCPRCDCEGNRLACEMCYYFGFKCPGNCACCADQRMSAQRQARVNNTNGQRASTKRRTPLRPLILRNSIKALAANNQKKASSIVSQPKAGNSSTSESSTNKVFPTVSQPSSNKVNLSKVKKSKNTKVNAEMLTPKHKVTYVVEPEVPPHVKEYIQKETEEYKRLWNRLFWPQWEKVPCEPQNTNQNTKTNIISKEKLEEAISELIGDHCLNCHCKNPRESCDICRRCDFQCLGTCMCCLPYRAGQRYMVFITRGIFQLSDGTYYGGGSVNISYTVPENSENHCEENQKAQKKSVWVRMMQAIQANVYLMNLSKAVTRTAISAFFVFIFIALNRNKTLLPEMLIRMRQTLLSYF